MSNKFKVGDTVVRTSKSRFPSQFGEVGVEYEVLELVGAGYLVVLEGEVGADPSYFELVVPDNSNKDTTAMTTSKFTVTTTKTTIKRVIDGRLSNMSFISIDPNDLTSINLVVGAQYCNQCASLFNKPSLQELINELQAVHDVMEDY
jgi:hypothetical protein